MPFPDADRVIYRKNPLKLVVCQVRFPTILRIGENAPSEFQERVRHEFPLFEEVDDGANFQLADGLSQIVPREILDAVSTRSNLRYQFLTRDRSWTASLTREFLALETTEYRCWEEFMAIMEVVLRALIEAYVPSFLTRIGLRYQNVINRKELQLEEVDWRELLAHSVIGPLALEETLDRVVEHHCVSRIQLYEPGEFVRIEYGLVNSRSQDTSEIMYLLDNDFSTVKETEVEVNNVIRKLSDFNTLNRRLFRYCVSERLHKAMEPDAT